MLGKGLFLKSLKIIYPKILQFFGIYHPDSQSEFNFCHQLRKSSVESDAIYRDIGTSVVLGVGGFLVWVDEAEWPGLFLFVWQPLADQLDLFSPMY